MLTAEQEITTYIKAHPVAIIGTQSKDKSLHGAAVYICATSPKQLYFVTKSETRKLKDIADNPVVSVTIADPNDNSTLQATGHAEIEYDANVINLVMDKMTKIYAQSADWLPPITKIRAGVYQVVSIKLAYARLAKFQNAAVGSEHIFKEI